MSMTTNDLIAHTNEVLLALARIHEHKAAMHAIAVPDIMAAIGSKDWATVERFCDRLHTAANNLAQEAFDIASKSRAIARKAGAK